MLKILLLILVPMVLQTSALLAQALGERYAFIIGGIGGLEEYTEKYFRQSQRMYNFLVDTLKYDPAKVIYLFEKRSYDSLKIDDRSTAKNVRKGFAKLALDMKKEDQLLVFMVGHGTFDGVWSKFNLVGSDLKDIEYAQLLEQLPSQKIIFINMAGASGPFIKNLSKKNRIIITATKNGNQYHATTFADFFLDALAAQAADTDKDNRVSITEAFKFARKSQDTWYEEERRIRAEHPLLDDNGDGEGSQMLAETSDGLLARHVYLNPNPKELETSIQKIAAGSSSAADTLLVEKVRLQEEIDNLKARKSQMSEDEYARQLELLLIKLARVNQRIKKSTQKK